MDTAVMDESPRTETDANSATALRASVSAAALLLAACGGGGGDVSTGAGTTPPAVVSPPVAPPVVPPVIVTPPPTAQDAARFLSNKFMNSDSMSAGSCQ